MAHKTTKTFLTTLLAAGLSFGAVGCSAPADTATQIKNAETPAAAKALAVEEIAEMSAIEIVTQMTEQAETVVVMLGEMDDEAAMKAVAGEMKVMSARGEALMGRQGEFDIATLQSNEEFVAISTRLGQAQQDMTMSLMRLQGEKPELVKALQKELEAVQ